MSSSRQFNPFQDVALAAIAEKDPGLAAQLMVDQRKLNKLGMVITVALFAGVLVIMGAAIWSGKKAEDEAKKK